MELPLLSGVCLLMALSVMAEVASDEGQNQTLEVTSQPPLTATSSPATSGGGYLEARQKCMVYCEQTTSECMETCSRGRKLCRKACVKAVSDCKTQCHIQFRDLAPPIDPEHLDEHIDHEHENSNDDHLYFDDKYSKKKNHHADHLARYRSEL